MKKFFFKNKIVKMSNISANEQIHTMSMNSQHVSVY